MCRVNNTVGSNPAPNATMGMWRNGLAQLTVNQEVVGSSPSIPANTDWSRNMSTIGDA